MMATACFWLFTAGPFLLPECSFPAFHFGITSELGIIFPFSSLIPLFVECNTQLAWPYADGIARASNIAMRVERAALGQYTIGEKLSLDRYADAGDRNVDAAVIAELTIFHRPMAT
jgi:hypothetical protein